MHINVSICLPVCVPTYPMTIMSLRHIICRSQNHLIDFWGKISGKSQPLICNHRMLQTVSNLFESVFTINEQSNSTNRPNQIKYECEQLKVFMSSPWFDYCVVYNLRLDTVYLVCVQLYVAERVSLHKWRSTSRYGTTMHISCSIRFECFLIYSYASVTPLIMLRKRWTEGNGPDSNENIIIYQNPKQTKKWIDIGSCMKILVALKIVHWHIITRHE